MSDVKETLRILRGLGAALWNFLVLHLFMQAVQKCNPERNPLKVKAERVAALDEAILQTHNGKTLYLPTARRTEDAVTCGRATCF